MVRWPIVVLAGALISIGCSGGPSRALAFDFHLTGPVTRGNLATYFVESDGPGGPGMLTLDQAAAQGAVKIYQQDVVTRIDPGTHQKVLVNGPVAMENLSALSVLVPLGTLLKGGLQDQVVARTFILPPRSGRVSIDTLCVDPFRSTARVGDSAEVFSAPSALFPWRTAKLSALTAASNTSVVPMSIRGVRQEAIWWSMDSLRYAMARKLGVPLEPAVPAHWAEDEDLRANTLLDARRGGWKSSLPMSLENPQLAQALKPFMAALQPSAANRRIIGAVFVIDGRIEGADIYRSHALFEQMWPQLLRAYATEAIAYSDSKPAHLPKIREVLAFLTAAERAPAKEVGGGNEVSESDAAIYATTSAGGAWVYRSYVAKLPADRASPEGTLMAALDSGKMDGKPIANLGDAMLVLHNDGQGRFTDQVAADPNNSRITILRVRPRSAADEGWHAAIVPPQSPDAGFAELEARATELRAAERRVEENERTVFSAATVFILAIILGVIAGFIGILHAGTGLRIARVVRLPLAFAAKGLKRLAIRLMPPQIKEPLPLPTARPVGLPAMQRPVNIGEARRWQAIRTAMAHASQKAPEPEEEPVELLRAA